MHDVEINCTEKRKNTKPCDIFYSCSILLSTTYHYAQNPGVEPKHTKENQRGQHVLLTGHKPSNINYTDCVNKSKAMSLLAF